MKNEKEDIDLILFKKKQEFGTEVRELEKELKTARSKLKQSEIENSAFVEEIYMIKEGPRIEAEKKKKAEEEAKRLKEEEERLKKEEEAREAEMMRRRKKKKKKSKRPKSRRSRK